MSKGSLFWGNAQGKLGETVFYRAGGQQRNRTYIKSFLNPKTRAQMTQRVKWPNVVAWWRLFKSFIQMGMMDKPLGQSDYNHFMSLNLRQAPAYMTKDEAAAGGSVLAVYSMTSGSLPAVEMVGAAESSLVVGDLNLETATIGEVSFAIINNNPGFRIGDQITFICAGQTLGQGGLPRVVPAAFKFLLTAATDATLFLDVVQKVGFATPALSNGNLGWEFSGSEYVEYGSCAIHSRIENGQLQVSSSVMKCDFLVPDIQQGVTTGVSLDDALASYGYTEPAYLSPRSAAEYVPAVRPIVQEVVLNTSQITDGASVDGIPAGDATLNIYGENLMAPGSNFVVTYNGSVVPQFDASVDTQLIYRINVVKQENVPLTITWNGGSITAGITGSVL